MAVPADDELHGLLDSFVCVRIVQMHGVDLQRLAFDGSLTWAVFFANADGALYGRYGTRSGLREKSDKEISLAGFKKSLRGALALHARYVADEEAVGAELAGKVAATPPRWATPEEIPTLRRDERYQTPFSGMAGRPGGCIHCHMVSTNELRSLREKGEDIPDRKFFPYPLPDALGFRMDPAEMATVESVTADSLAAAADLRAGDQVRSIEGQPVLSTADIQWVLHNSEDRDRLELQVARGKDSVQLSLDLPEGWRRDLPDWRFINKALLRQVLGFNVTAMPEERARRMGLGGKLALVVDRTSRDLRMLTGLGNRDLIVAIDGKREPLTVGQFTTYVFRQKPEGSVLKVTIMQVTDRLPRPESTVDVPVR